MLSIRARHWLPLLAFFVVALAVSAACGGDDDGEATTGASPTAAAAEESTQGTAAFPVTVTDLLGREVEIGARPERVVALSPTAGELVYAAGGTLVGRVSSVNYPEEAREAEDVGIAYQPNFEAVLALNPDLVVADSVIHAAPSFRDPLEALDVPVIFAGADSYQAVIDGLNLMGKVFGDPEKTDAVIANIESSLAEAQSMIGDTQVSAVVLIADRDQVLYGAKPASYAGDILAKLGVENPAASQPDSGPFPGYTALAPETLVQFDPDVVITVTPAPPPAPRLSEVFVKIPPFQSLKAVQEGRVVEIPAELLLQAPGPRLAEALLKVAEAVAGP